MIRWTKEGKVDRHWFVQSSPTPYIQASNELADALDAAVVALRHIALMVQPSRAPRVAVDALRRLGGET